MPTSSSKMSKISVSCLISNNTIYIYRKVRRPGTSGGRLGRHPRLRGQRRRRPRPCPLRAIAHRRRPHRALQLPLRVLQERKVRPPRRGHRPRVLHQEVRGGRPHRPLLARPRLGLRPVHWWRFRPLPPVGSQCCVQRACPEANGVVLFIDAFALTRCAVQEELA
ncbi:uncharacterized protein LOC123428398 [Hordeum vulgare subsp. vulgare]|uniref:uncharacterized protein LOC123428398 n=1 Tax=Hordeum vulgare subsp. vulgare TaxID=112509 RepID=UPI001D1A3C94|nr:uncharacterized protein LOC123428398 [Hordeum vulgare subsp. vulgare]